MSASDKKKLRKEQDAAKLTEKQLAAQKEAKKLNLYTTIFVAVLAVLLVVAIGVGATQAITNSGMREKNTVAVTIGDHEISNAELNYYYMDAINNFYGQYGQYAAMFGLDANLPLNEQVVDADSGLTWADDFLAQAKDSVKSIYAMKDQAEAAGFTLPQETIDALDQELESLDLYAAMYGYPDGETYLKGIYGKGASLKSYREYSLNKALANAYYQEYAQSLTYEDADLRAAEEDNFNAYSSFSYNAYYLPISKFRTGGTTDADGNTTYTDEETAAAVAAAEAAAKSLAVSEIDSVAALDKAIAALDINKDASASSTAYQNTLYSSVSSTYAEWVTDASRKAGDKGVIANVTKSTAEDGTETTVTNGYYVVYFLGSTDNNTALKNVRHILVAFAHDETTSEEHDHSSTEYTETEKNAAKTAAEELLAQWKAGEATEESFRILANEHSDDGDGTTGGLYENVYPGQMVANFNDWCFDESRASGDTGIVETNYGYHVMYFVGDSDTTYRDYQIENELRSADVTAWYTEKMDAMTVTDGDMKYIKRDLILNAAS